MTVDAIKEAINQLSDADRKQLAEWFEELEEQAWDEEIEWDSSPGGRGMQLLRELETEIAEGKTQPLELKTVWPSVASGRRDFRHRTFPRFWRFYDELLQRVQDLADAQFQLLREDPLHPSLRLKAVGEFWPVRVSLRCRALEIRRGDVFQWFWIGPHDEYDRMLNR
jgi:hypothetical protein